MEIQFLDLKSAYKELQTEIDQLWNDINRDSVYVLDKHLELFERNFAKYLGVKHVIGVANGLDALTLSIKALGIGKNDEVIVPSFTYVASWLAISETGATPVPVEVNNDYLMDPDNIRQSITSRTKAIMPVHLYGRVCNMEPIITIAKEYNLKIIEDSAQAHGAFEVSSGIKAGAFGDCSGFSFYPGKNLGCFGDGGCISTNDDELAYRLKLLRNYGSKIRYEHEIKAGNSRLDELQAGIISIKLKYLDEWNKRRQNIAKIYLHGLIGIPGLVLPEYDEGHVWHIFAIRTSKRDELQKFLSTKGIGTNIHYPKPIHMQKAYSDMNLKEGDFALTERNSREVLSLPIGPHLSEKEALLCIKRIKEFFKLNGVVK